MKAMLFGLWIGCAPVLLAADGLIASPESGWPQWRGPRRDGVSLEKNLLAVWPEGGPRRVWTSSPVGRGYASPIVVGERIYITGDVGEELKVFALDLEGREVWSASNGVAWKGPYPGARATCAYSEGRVYHLNAHGRLACYDAADGRPLWSVDVLERFGAKNITWAISEGVLVDGDRVLATAGGAKALVVALDKRTGATVWASPPLRLGQPPSGSVRVLAEPAGEADGPSYASLILFEQAGRRLLAGASLRHQFGVDAADGALLWAHPMKTTYSVIAATPARTGDLVFGTAPDGDGGLALRVSAGPEGVTATPAWRSEVDTCQGALLAVDGAIYAPWYRGKRGWAKIDASSGRILYDTREVAIGSGIFADGRLITLGQDGEAALLTPGADGFAVSGRFALTPRRVSDAWAHPVLLDGRLYLRHHERLECFDLRTP